MNPNICAPKLPPMFRSVWLVMTVLKITNMTVAMTVAIAVSKAAISVQIAIGNDHHLERSVIGVINIETKFMHMPVRKQPNMTWLAILISLRMSLTFAGNATVAPDKSSFRMIETGLNQ